MFAVRGGRFLNNYVEMYVPFLMSNFMAIFSPCILGWMFKKDCQVAGSTGDVRENNQQLDY